MEVMKTLSAKKRKQLEAILRSVPKDERKIWDEMVAEDEEMLLMCLREQFMHGGVFDIHGIKQHFMLSKLLVAAATTKEKKK